MESAVGIAATWLGLLVRWGLLGVRRAVEVTPLAMVVYGTYLLSAPAAWILAGLILSFFLYRPRVKR